MSVLFGRENENVALQGVGGSFRGFSELFQEASKDFQQVKEPYWGIQRVPGALQGGLSGFKGPCSFWEYILCHCSQVSFRMISEAC